ncbi:MAG: hypothetical protein AB7L66_13520 [Gemmatimonadales bacterium]
MASVPAWVGPTIALALAVIAVGFLGILIVGFVALRRAASEAQALSREIAELRRELSPTIQAMNRLAGSGAELGDRLKGEVEGFLSISRRLRRGLVRGSRRVERRLADLDALYEVVSTEVEDTALDVAAKLRGFRTGTSALRRIKRLLIRGRR